MARQTFGTQNPNQDALNRQLGVEGPPVSSPGIGLPVLGTPGLPGNATPSLRRPGETREDILLRTGSPIPGTPGLPGNATPSLSAQTQGQGVPSPPSPSGGAAGVGPFGLEGFDANKLASGHDSPKYQIGRAISQFDPTAGVTPEVLEALNALGIGTFNRLSGDKVQVTGNVDPRFEGYNTIDLVRGFNGPGGGQAWQYGADNGQGGGVPGGMAPPTAQAGAATAFNSAPGINSLLSGDPLQRIQQAIQGINGQGQVNLDALLSQLRGI